MPDLTDSEEDRLRRALAVIGEEAGRGDPVKGPVRPRASRRRRGIGIGALVAAVAAGIGLLTLTLGNPNTASPGGGDRAAPDAGGAGSGQGQTLLEWVACGRTIAVGDVMAVSPSGQDGRLTVTFAVRDWIKPSQGEREIELDVVDPAEARVREPWRVGQHLLIVVPQRRDLETDTFAGAELADNQADIEEALPEAERTPCPTVWRAEQN
ncbi:hypothetical protein OG292_21925 [Streptomyces sp. NBC_01511]|uniref:hypothetical protein n=1 Tax=unclassified Streptomyces TaxID=2593676 RepID=UPI00386F8AF6